VVNLILAVVHLSSVPVQVIACKGAATFVGSFYHYDWLSFVIATLSSHGQRINIK